MQFDSPTHEVEYQEIPEVPDVIPRDRWGRPMIIPKLQAGEDGGLHNPPVPYTRASTLGKAIEDTYHLNRWQRRTVAFGLSRNPGLLSLVAAIATNEGEDRKALDELCDKAHEAAKGDQGANVGTALHKLSERRDAGEDLSYLPEILLEAIDAYSVQMKPFKVLATETFVACDAVQTAGTFDRVVMLLVDLTFHHPRHGAVTIPSGTVLVLDLKTGKVESAKYWGPAYGVQQAVYQAGDPYTSRGRITWEELLGPGLVPSDKWAIILHVPSDSPKDAGLIVVDLEAGRSMAELCIQIREARKDRGLLSPAYPVPVPTQSPAPAIEAPACKYCETDRHKCPRCGEPSPHVRVDVASACRACNLLAAIDHADSETALRELYAANEDVWVLAHSRAAEERLALIASRKVRALPDADTTDPSADAPDLSKSDGPADPPPSVRRMQLIRELQMAKGEDVIAALYQAHQAIWDDNCTAMAKARVRQLEAVQA